MKSLTTDRLVLEPVVAANARELWRVLGMPDLRRYQDIPRLRAEEFERQVRTRPSRLAARVTGRFEWIVRESGEAIGWISLRINERTSEVGEIGYSLVEGARGRGYATEAVAAVLDETFVQTGLNELQACCVPDNAASRLVLDRTGFSEVRLLRSGAMIRGRHVDVLLYALHRGEWTRARRERVMAVNE